MWFIRKKRDQPTVAPLKSIHSTKLLENLLTWAAHTFHWRLWWFEETCEIESCSVSEPVFKHNVSSNSKHLRRTIRYHADHKPLKPFHYDTQFKSRFRCTQPLRSKYAIIIVIYRKNHPPFPLNCYLYALQTNRTHSPKLRLLLVIIITKKFNVHDIFM